MSRDLFNLRREKFQREQAHVQRLLFRGLHPVEIADRLIHIMLEVLFEGFKLKYPHLDEQELKLKMREHVLFYDKMKNYRRKV